MTDKPIRVRLSRAKGWKMPLNTVIVDCTTAWGNPFAVGKRGGAYSAKVMNQRHAMQLYRSVAFDNEKLVGAAREQIRGKNLACWCALDAPCHADVLLEIANG